VRHAIRFLIRPAIAVNLEISSYVSIDISRETEARITGEALGKEFP
jgi:hypothetical protein